MSYSFFAEYRRNLAVKELKDFSNVNRRMLNARARIQQILINAAIAQRTLKATEIDDITRLWKSAEYDQTDDIQLNDDGSIKQWIKKPK